MFYIFYCCKFVSVIIITSLFSVSSLEEKVVRVEDELGPFPEVTQAQCVAACKEIPEIKITECPDLCVM